MSNINTLTEIVEKHWSRSINKRFTIIKQLINFKRFIKLKNTEMEKVANDTTKSEVLRFSIIIAIKKNLISYIGTWFINIQQGLISYHIIKESLGYFIFSEYKLMQPIINDYLTDKSHIHYSDAICCKILFNKCSK